MNEKKQRKNVERSNPFRLPILSIAEGVLGDPERMSHARLATEAQAVEALFTAFGIGIRPTSSLGTLITKTKALPKDAGKATWEEFFVTMMFYRVSSTLLSVGDEPSIETYLRALVSDSLDLLERTPSHAKDLLWELELFSLLKTSGFSVVLRDPPDILWRWNDMEVGIACKKIYSDKNVSKVLSQAVAQVEKVAEFGIAALNIDDRCPARSILQASDAVSGQRQLGERCEQFIGEHQRHFNKYLSEGRLIAALVAITAIADVRNSKPRFLNISDYLCWSQDGHDDKRMQAIAHLSRSLTGGRRGIT